jgi:hypothetical protein
LAKSGFRCTPSQQSSLEDLFGESETSQRKRSPTPKRQKHIEAIAQLPRAKQQFVAQMLEAMLAQAQQ